MVLTVTYYGLYCVAARAHRESGAGRGVLLASFLLITFIGFLFSTNLTLGQTPSARAGKYFADPCGWNLNLSEPTLLSRYLHFFTATVAVGGLLLMLLAYCKRESDANYRQYVFRFGGRAFEFATMAQFAIGFWFLVSLPLGQRTLFLGDNGWATSLLAAGIAGAVAAILVVARALPGRTTTRLGAIGGTGITVLVVLAMAVMRDVLRDNYLKPYFHPERFLVSDAMDRSASVPGGLRRRSGPMGGDVMAIPVHCRRATAGSGPIRHKLLLPTGGHDYRIISWDRTISSIERQRKGPHYFHPAVATRFGTSADFPHALL